MTQQFTAKVYKVGINPCVDVPLRVSQAFGKRGYIPVEGTLDGEPIAATLVPTGGGHHRLYLNTDMRKRAGVDAGDRVKIELAIDTKPRDIAAPEDLLNALKRKKGALQAFRELTPSRRKEIIVYLLSLKTEETRKKQIKRVVDSMARREE
jgi:Domain of unknown function (DUF1905)/Bacteriocin-protection, YdeI or OmpD-Associated